MSDQQFAMKLKRRTLQSELHSLIWWEIENPATWTATEYASLLSRACTTRVQFHQKTRIRDNRRRFGDEERIFARPASRWRSIRDREPRRVPRRGAHLGSPRRDEIHVGWPAAWHWALKRKLNEISNRQELPRIGPIKLLPPVPRVYARILTVNFVVGN